MPRVRSRADATSKPDPPTQAMSNNGSNSQKRVKLERCLLLSGLWRLRKGQARTHAVPCFPKIFVLRTEVSFGVKQPSW